jgi:pimeloyl-ACP methyl ester carboxylesterase
MHNRNPSCRYPLVPLSLFLLLLAGSLPVAAGETIEADCEVRSEMVPIAGGTIHYDRAGHGPPVLLLHGLFAQKAQWREVLCELASAGFDVIVPDLPGFGQSDGYSVTVYDLDRQVELLNRLADVVDVESFHLAGNSLGGAIAAVYAQRHPARVRRLAFIGPPLGLEPWGPRVRRAIIDGVNPFIPLTSAQFDLEMALLFEQPPIVPENIRRSLIHEYVARSQHYHQVWDIINLFDSILQDACGEPLEINSPVLIVWGESDAIYPVGGARSFNERLPDSQLVIMPETGHLPMMERSEETARHLTRFLRDQGNVELLSGEKR